MKAQKNELLAIAIIASLIIKLVLGHSLCLPKDY